MKKDLTGKIFGKLLVKGVDDEVEKHTKNRETYWICECECGAICSVRGSSLTSGNNKSCGCLRNSSRKYNDYNLSGEYGVGYTNKTNKEFYFDLEDYDKIKDYCWHIDSKGYVMCTRKNKKIKMHALVMGESILEVDHINNHPEDNRKVNLRCCTHSENLKNQRLKSTNTSGISGVTMVYGKWLANITVNGRAIRLGTYKNKNDAIKQRLMAEREYFGDFSPQSYLFKEYL